MGKLKSLPFPNWEARHDNEESVKPHWDMIRHKSTCVTQKGGQIHTLWATQTLPGLSVHRTNEITLTEKGCLYPAARPFCLSYYLFFSYSCSGADVCRNRSGDWSI
jgi:hypothetical protein